MLENLTTRLSRVVKGLRGQARLTDDNIQDALREVRLALLEADVALPVVRDFIALVKEKAVGEEVMGSLTPGQALIGVVHRELSALMGGAAAPLSFATQPPAVILMAGLQGSGKTTSTGKLARLLQEQKKKVLLVSADVYRPAAIEQLRLLAAQVGAEFFPSTPDQSPVAIAHGAIDWARRHYHDVVIVDTAGRLGVDEAMMREIADLHAAVHPIETLFVVDAMQGQDAVNTAKAFRDALPLTGVVLTKLDGDARGGAALSVRAVTGAPVLFAGLGEKLDALEVFHPDRMATRILGMGDVLTLIERAEQVYDEKQALALQKKLRRNEFTLDDFRDQLRAVRKMGAVGDLMKMIPGMNKLTKGMDMSGAETELKRTEAIINSMTREERDNATIINGSRRRRIAAGSGVSVADVNKFLKQFQQTKKMMKHVARFAGGKGMPGMS